MDPCAVSSQNGALARCLGSCALELGCAAAGGVQWPFFFFQRTAQRSQETPGCRCGGPWSDFQHLLNFTLAHAPDCDAGGHKHSQVFLLFVWISISISISIILYLYIYIYPYHFHIDIYIYPLPSDTHWKRLPFQSARTPPVFWQLALRWLWASAKLWPSHWCIRWPRISMKVRTGRDFSGSRTWIDDIYLQYDIYII